MVAAEEIPAAALGQRRAGRLVLQLADLAEHVIGDGQVGEERGEDPEHDDAEADHADGGIEELAVKPEPPPEAQRQREEDDERDPDRHEPPGHRAEDAGIAARQDGAAEDVDEDEGHQREEEPAHRPFGKGEEAGAGRRGAVGIDPDAGVGREERQRDLQDHRHDQRRRRREEDRVQDGQRAGPGQRVHASSSLRKSGCAGSGTRSPRRR